jgi:hypothetical protein
MFIRSNVNTVSVQSASSRARVQNSNDHDRGMIKAGHRSGFTYFELMRRYGKMNALEGLTPGSVVRVDNRQHPS